MNGSFREFELESSQRQEVQAFGNVKEGKSKVGGQITQLICPSRHTFHAGCLYPKGSKYSLYLVSLQSYRLT